jgi:hypothetical protein
MEPKTKKILIATGIVGVLSIIGYKLLAKGSPLTNVELPNTNTTPTKEEAPPIEDISIYTNSEIAAMKAAEEKAATTINKYTSEELADLLQDDFKGAGTNWSAGEHGGIVGVLLQLKSDEDFDNLNSAYGIRVIKAGTIRSLFEKPYVGDLNGAFNSELSKREIAKVNDILSKKGINRRITTNGVTKI